MRYWKHAPYSLCVLCLYVNYADANIMLAPNIQGTTTENIIHATLYDDRYYLNIQDMADALRFQFNPYTNSGVFLEQPFAITASELNRSDFLQELGQDFYSVSFYEKLFPIKLKVDPKEAILDVSSDYTLPTTRGLQNAENRRRMDRRNTDDAYSVYEYDNRWFTFPVLDLIYKHNWLFNNIHRDNYRRTDNNYYQANSAMIFAGLDTQVTLFGDDFNTNKLTDVGARISGSKIWLNEKEKPLNMAKFQVGDIVTDGNGLFYYGGAGRGVSASSFKDFVTAADKTIDISGSMPIGWEAELYQNNQLIGFRQSSLDGRYEFLNVPVNYGLNDFKVVLYGPFGEIRTVNQRYYSGGTPVKAGEFGYNLSAQQPNRFLIETDDFWHSESDKIAANSMLYYGVTDRLSLMGGLTNAINPSDINSDSQFGALGAILALDGLSIQYDTTYNMTTNKIGQHIDAQGDVYIGTLFARYEYYGDTHSPISYYQNEYLRNLFEARLSGSVLNIPYYISYTHRDGDNRYQDLQMRLSPNFMQYYNFTLEDTLSRNPIGTENYLSALGQTTFGRFRANGQIKYRTNPSNTLMSYGAFLEYRWDKNTYVQTTWEHDCRSHYANAPDADTGGISVGRLFKFGGIVLDFTADTDRNISVGLTYNISIGKSPNQYSLFANSENQMMNYGTVFVHAHDEMNNPVPDIDILVSGRESPTKTDENGEAIITNIETYQKAIINIDEQDAPDIALNPDWHTKKLILRPGTVRPIELTLNHLGGFEGRISVPHADEKYVIYVRDSTGQVVAVKTVDPDGAFLFDGLKYGTYEVSVYNGGVNPVGKTTITINRNFQTIDTPIQITTSDK